MFLKIKQFVIIITIIFFSSCKPEGSNLSKITASQIAINDSLQTNDSLDFFIKPYRERINQILDSTLAYAPMTLTKEDGKYNSSAGNLMADVLLELANPIFKLRTGNEIDFVLVNHGGIRSIISEGNVSARTAYQIMPFENTISVVELTGSSVKELVAFLVQSKRAHPIAGMQIVLDASERLKFLKIRGKPLVEKQHYFVATSSYLVTGGDNMVFFKDAISITETDYSIRNALIDYFKKVDTLKAKVDDRFVKL